MKDHYTLFLKSLAATAVVVAAALLAGNAVGSNRDSKPGSDHPQVNINLDPSSISREGLPSGSFAPIVQRVAPAVVKVTTSTPVNPSSLRESPVPDDPIWRYFFGEPFGRNTPRRQFAPPTQRGLGSGVIVTEDGYIITNHHVVDGAKEVTVTLEDGREFTAKVVGVDPKSDVAVIRIDAANLPTVPMADSGQVKVGDVVLAIGNPFGVGQTVTQGIVSATGRGDVGIEDYEDFIQTDAAINPGNSGGALVDIQGRLIGINTAILSRSGGSQGVGFAIPTKLARSVMQNLVEHGVVKRGQLGVLIQSLNPTLAREFGLDNAEGALVGDVVPNSPAERAGIKPGDVIVKFNDHKIKERRELQLEVAATAPGSVVPVEIIRDGSKKSLHVTLSQLPDDNAVAQRSANPSNSTGTLDGVTVADLDRETRAQFNIPREIQGALITDVDPASPAAEAGLRPGSVLLEINRQPVRNADDAVRMTENAKNKRSLLRIWDNGGSRYLLVDESRSTTTN